MTQPKELSDRLLSPTELAFILTPSEVQRLGFQVTTNKNLAVMYTGNYHYTYVKTHEGNWKYLGVMHNNRLYPQGASN